MRNLLATESGRSSVLVAVVEDPSRDGADPGHVLDLGGMGVAVGRKHVVGVGAAICGPALRCCCAADRLRVRGGRWEVAVLLFQGILPHCSDLPVALVGL